ncbi:MAG: Enoyl-CoA hydratase, partial [uncultured Actinomycetospora sp.]
DHAGERRRDRPAHRARGHDAGHHHRPPAGPQRGEPGRGPGHRGRARRARRRRRAGHGHPHGRRRILQRGHGPQGLPARRAPARRGPRVRRHHPGSARQAPDRGGRGPGAGGRVRAGAVVRPRRGLGGGELRHPGGQAGARRGRGGPDAPARPHPAHRRDGARAHRRPDERCRRAPVGPGQPADRPRRRAGRGPRAGRPDRGQRPARGAGEQAGDRLRARLELGGDVGAPGRDPGPGALQRGRPRGRGGLRREARPGLEGTL